MIDGIAPTDKLSVQLADFISVSDCANTALRFSMLYTSHGPRAAWLLQIISLSAVIGLWGVSYNRLVPLEQRKESEKKDTWK